MSRDAADLADQVIEIQMKEALSRVQSLPHLEPTGYCHNCEDDSYVGPYDLFCDNDCRDDYDKRQRRS